MLLKEVITDERPREKALSYGVSSLSNNELIAILLRTGTKNMSVLELSQLVLNHFNGLKNLANASLNDLIKIKGIKKAKAISLLASIELAKRLNQLPMTNDKVIHTSKDVFDYMGSKLKYEPQEKFMALFLDTKNKIIYEKLIYIGSLNVSVIHPRDIFREAIHCNCARIIMIHNHPSGNPTPSKNDIEATKQIFKTGKIMQIDLLDHIIIGFDRFVSLREQGFFESF